MGGTQSAPTRTITIPNEESHFIKVSEAVAERLRRCKEKSPEDVYKNDEDCPPNAYQKNVNSYENLPVSRQLAGDNPMINYYYGPSITSIRILQEKEKELKESESYWSKRIENLENHHAKLSQIMEEEYSKAINEIRCQNPRPPPNTPFPCSEEKDKLLKCYQKNPEEILLCAGEVTQFAECVHSKRITPEKREDCN